MRVLFLASEMAPFSKTGGLGDVIAALPGSLRSLGIDVRVLLPYYGYPERSELRFLGTAHPPYTKRLGEIWSLGTDDNIYFLRQPEYYERGGIYQNAAGQDWEDNPERFAYVNRVAVELCQGRLPFLDWRADLLHAHDWQASLAPYLLALESRIGAPRPKTLLSIHNLAYQGRFAPELLDVLHLPKEDFHPGGVELYGSFSFLKAGLVFADALSTVSPSYAREIQEEGLGMGLGGLLRSRQQDLYGILNGIDVTRWNPAADPYLPAHFTAHNRQGKTQCKIALQTEMGLIPDPQTLLLGMVSRMVEQKGADLVLALVPQLMERPIQLVLLGTGDVALQEQAQRLAWQYPGKMAVRIGFDEGLAHRIEAGIDAFLMPSRFEPCGLNQMYSLRYGSLPIVHGTGGLADTVRDLHQDQQGNGFVFRPATQEALAQTIARAERVFHTETLQWHAAQTIAMQENHSWQRAAEEYQSLYRHLLSGA